MNGSQSVTATFTTRHADKVRIETAANGSGSPVGAQNVAVGETVIGYAIERDASNFVARGRHLVTTNTGGVVRRPRAAQQGATFTGARAAGYSVVDGLHRHRTLTVI
jgi:hypothetical protein